MKLAVFAFVLCTLPALADELPPDLAQAMKVYDEGQFHNDVPTLERLVADDYVLVNSDSTLQNKQSFLADFRVPGFRLDPYVMEQRVAKVWGGAAVMAGLVRLSFTQDGKRQTRRLRLVHVWAKRDGRWQVTHTQLTRVPDAADAPDG